MFRLSKLFSRQSLIFYNYVSRGNCSLSPYEIQHQTGRFIKADQVPMALYGGINTVTLIPGAGIGPECLRNVRRVFKCLGVPVYFEIVDIISAKNQELEFENAIISVRRNGVAIKGNIVSKSENENIIIKNVKLRTELALYVYIHHCKSYPGIRSRFSDIDVVVIRQNTEGEYTTLEHQITIQSPKRTNLCVQSLKIITRTNALRLARYAFEYAKKNGRKKVTTVHKANIMKFSDGLFLQCSEEVAKEYPEITHENIIIDNCCMQIVQKPQQFDVLLTPNLYGNIVAAILCGLCGGPGLSSGINYGDHYAIFEPGNRNIAEEIAGKNQANPVAMLNASVDLLFHLGHQEYAKKIENAIWKTLTEDKIHTPDIGGTATSEDVVANVINLCIKT